VGCLTMNKLLWSGACFMTQMVKHAPPLQFFLRETPKYSVNISSRFSNYYKNILSGGARLTNCFILRINAVISNSSSARLDIRITPPTDHQPKIVPLAVDREEERTEAHVARPA
jgi:hypothetical protein